MTELLKRFLNICLLANGPQDLPHSALLFRVLLLVYFISGSLSMLPSAIFLDGVLIMLLDVSILLLFTWLCLQAFKKQSRFVQTVTALAGTGTIFQMLALPLLVQTASFSQADAASMEVSLLLLIIISWNLAVFAHIFRHAFGVGMLPAFIMTLAYVVINVTARHILFPQSGV